MDQDRHLTPIVADWAIEDDVSFSLTWKGENGDLDFLKRSLDKNSTNDVRETLNSIRTVGPFEQIAKTVGNEFGELCSKQPDLLYEVLSSDLLVFKACRLKVHSDFINPKLRQNEAVHVYSRNTVLEWTTVRDDASLELNWRNKHPDQVASMERKGNASKSEAFLVFVCIKDAAKTGMKGIIRKLLLNRAPVRIFKEDIVKWVVLYKWLKIWKPKFVRSAVFYLAFLLCFTSYAVFLCSSRIGDCNEADLVSCLASEHVDDEA